MFDLSKTMRAQDKVLAASGVEAKEFSQSLEKLKFELGEKVSLYLFEEQIEHLQTAVPKEFSGGSG